MAAGMGRAAIVALVLGGLLALPQGLVAHSLLQSSDPAAGSTVAMAPSAVSLTFGEAPDPKLSSVKVLDAGSNTVSSGPAVAVPGSPNELRVPVESIPDGVYTVAWRTVSAVDGHSAAGSFAFGVGVAPGAGAAGGSSATATSLSGSVAGSLARFLLYVGLIGLFGAGFVGAAVHPAPPRSIVVFALGSWVLSAIGAVGVMAIQIADSGADLGSFLGSALGGGLVSRVLVIAGSALVVGALAAWPGSIERWLYALAAAAAAGGMLVDVLFGHAAASGQVTIDVAIQLVHIIAAGLWMGGLAALLLSLRGSSGGDGATAARRFARWAGIALGAIAVTGLLRAIQEVGTFDALLSSDFGRLVIIKSVLFGILAVLGTLNHFVSVPASIRTLAPLRRIGRVEVTVGVIALIATSLLVNLAPPASAAASPEQPATPPVTASGNDFGTSVRVRLVVTPGTAGVNQFTATVTDFDSGQPVDANGVTLRFSAASAHGVGDSSLALAATGGGTYAASAGNLSLDGIWNLVAVVAASTGTVEVPLAIATAIPGEDVEANPVAGAPTIFSAHLAGGYSLQVYLDPGRSGANELHETFFDAAGTELAVSAATLLVSPQRAPSTIVAARQLEPGHFVADLDVAGATLGVDVVGSASDGGTTLHAHFDIPVQP